jgi:hypothetical protein
MGESLSLRQKNCFVKIHKDGQKNTTKDNFVKNTYGFKACEVPRMKERTEGLFGVSLSQAS